jgi:hypothetical protein
MVAKVHGLARLMSVVSSINTDAEGLAAEFEQAAERLNGSMQAARNNIGNMKAAAEALDSVNAAFGGNGSPPLSDSPLPLTSSAEPAVDPRPSGVSQVHPSVR